jgi:hypothetical protein
LSLRFKKSDYFVLLIIIISFIATITKEYIDENYFSLRIIIAILIMFIFAIILKKAGYGGHVINIIYEIVKPVVTFWFDFLKWLLILSALILAINKTHDDTLGKILDLSYVFIFIFLNSLALKNANLMRSKVEASKLSVEDKESIGTLIGFLVAMFSVILILIITKLPDIVNRLGQ